MSIGDELWTLAKALAYSKVTDEDVALPNWEYKDYFCIPEEFFVQEAVEMHLVELEPPVWQEIARPLKEMLQPSKAALEVLMEYEDFWALEPPVLAIHSSEGIPPGFYAQAMSQLQYESVVVFNDDPDEEDLESDFFYFQSDEYWVVPHMMSFCDYHILSDSPDSWWGTFLSDDREAIYPSPNPNRIFPSSWTALTNEIT